MVAAVRDDNVPILGEIEPESGERYWGFGLDQVAAG
jgi:hypothetical protein